MNKLKKEHLIIYVVLLVIVGAGAFYGGVKYQSSKTASGRQLASGTDTRGGPRASGANGANRPVVGQIASMDASSITVKLSDGSSKIVLTNGSTTISKTDSATIADLKTGDNVGVFGVTNSDGSVTAQNIQLNPMFRFGQGGGQGGQNTTGQ